MTDQRDAVERLMELAGPRRAPAGDHYDRALRTARAAWLDEVRRTRRLRAARVAVASLTAAVVLIAAGMTWRNEPAAPAATPADVIVATHNGAPLRLGSSLRTDPATRTALQLASGIEVRLDRSTEIAFVDRSTMSLARGAVFIDTGSAAGPNRSIDVRTPLGSVRDVGTKFEVRLIDAPPAAAGSRGSTARPPPSPSQFMRVRVRDGIVRVTTPGGTESAERGTELVATARGITRASAPVTGEDWDWVTLAAPPFALDGRTLADFLAWAASEGAWEIRFQTEALARSASTIVINGSVDGLPPEQALRAVLATCGLTHRRNGEVITIEAGAAP